jgi:hypothetical protein
MIYNDELARGLLRDESTLKGSVYLEDECSDELCSLYSQYSSNSMNKQYQSVTFHGISPSFHFMDVLLQSVPPYILLTALQDANIIPDDEEIVSLITEFNTVLEKGIRDLSNEGNDDDNENVLTNPEGNIEFNNKKITNLKGDISVCNKINNGDINLVFDGVKSFDKQVVKNSSCSSSFKNMGTKTNIVCNNDYNGDMNLDFEMVKEANKQSIKPSFKNLDPTKTNPEPLQQTNRNTNNHHSQHVSKNMTSNVNYEASMNLNPLTIAHAVQTPSGVVVGDTETFSPSSSFSSFSSSSSSSSSFSSFSSSKPSSTTTTTNASSSTFNASSTSSLETSFVSDPLLVIQLENQSPLSEESDEYARSIWRCVYKFLKKRFDWFVKKKAKEKEQEKGKKFKKNSGKK